MACCFVILSLQSGLDSGQDCGFVKGSRAPSRDEGDVSFVLVLNPHKLCKFLGPCPVVKRRKIFLSGSR